MGLGIGSEILLIFGWSFSRSLIPEPVALNHGMKRRLLWKKNHDCGIACSYGEPPSDQEIYEGATEGVYEGAYESA